MSDPALHCPQCAYNLTGLPENRCPECGTPFDPAKLRHKPRYAVQPFRWRELAYFLLPIPLASLGLLGMARSLRLEGAWRLLMLLGLFTPFIAIITSAIPAIRLADRITYKSGRRVQSWFHLLLFLALALLFYVPQVAIGSGPLALFLRWLASWGNFRQT